MAETGIGRPDGRRRKDRKRMERGNLKATAALLAAVFSCSMSSIFFKYMTAPSSVAAAYRLGFTVLLLTPVALGKAESRKELFSLKARDVGLCFLSGAFLALHFYSWFESLNHTSITSSTVLVNTEVLFAAFGYLFFFHKKLKKMETVSYTHLDVYKRQDEACAEEKCR